MRHVATTSWFSSSPPLLKGGWWQLIPDFAMTEREQIGCGILSLTETFFWRRLARWMERAFQIEFWVMRLLCVVSIINEQKVGVLVRGLGLGHTLSRTQTRTHTHSDNHTAFILQHHLSLSKKKAWLAFSVQLSTTASFRRPYVAVHTHPRTHTHPHTPAEQSDSLFRCYKMCTFSRCRKTHVDTLTHRQIHTWTSAVITYASFYWLHRLLLCVPLSLQRLFVLLCKWEKKKTRDGAITRLDALPVAQCIASLPTPAHSQTLSL